MGNSFTLVATSPRSAKICSSSVIPMDWEAVASVGCWGTLIIIPAVQQIALKIQFEQFFFEMPGKVGLANAAVAGNDNERRPMTIAISPLLCLDTALHPVEIPVADSVAYFILFI